MGKTRQRINSFAAIGQIRLFDDDYIWFILKKVRLFQARKSSCVNARGIPPAAKRVLLLLFEPGGTLSQVQIQIRGRRYPIPGSDPDGGYPIPDSDPDGVLLPRSGSRWIGTPVQPWMGGTPSQVQIQMGDTPSQIQIQMGGPHPRSRSRWGVPPSSLGWGEYPNTALDGGTPTIQSWTVMGVPPVQ